MNKYLKGKYLFLIIVFISVFFISCKNNQQSSKPEPVIKRVSADSDLALALDVRLVKYEFDLSGFNVPSGKLVYIEAWLELLQGDKKIQEWTMPNMVCGNSGYILFSYYKPPLFKNDQQTIEAKIIMDSAGLFSKNINIDMPFKIQAHAGGFNENILEMDREYTLIKIIEMYSPEGKGIIIPAESTNNDETENKALILKIRFGLVDK